MGKSTPVRYAGLNEGRTSRWRRRAVAPSEELGDTRPRGWPRCPECGKWAVPNNEWPHPVYAWSCPQYPASGPFTLEGAEGRHEWYRLTDNREVQEAEPFPGAPPVAVTPGEFHLKPRGVLLRAWRRLMGQRTPLRYARLDKGRTSIRRRRSVRKPDVRRFRVYAKDLMLGDLIVAEWWPDGERTTRDCGWRVTKIEQNGDYYRVGRDDQFKHSFRPHETLSVDREV